MAAKNYSSKNLSQVVNELVNLGYTTEFVYERNSLYCQVGNEKVFCKTKRFSNYADLSL